MTNDVGERWRWCLAYRTCSVNVKCCKRNKMMNGCKEMLPGHESHQAPVSLAPPVPGPVHISVFNSTCVHRTATTCPRKREGGETRSWQEHNGTGICHCYPRQDTVPTNMAHLSPRKRGNVYKPKPRRFRFQALDKDEDSAGLGREVRKRPCLWVWGVPGDKALAILDHASNLPAHFTPLHPLTFKLELSTITPTPPS